MNSSLHIQTAVRNNSTYLKDSYFTPPFKVVNITENKNAQPLHLMVMSSSPGILNGDRHQVKIALDEGSSLHLHTQSYQRLFNMKQSASGCMEVFLEPQSSFIYLPHPIVPHTQSVFKSENSIYLKENCSLVYGEILTCGRKLNGERFQYSKFHNLTQVFLQDRLIIRENLLMEPQSADLEGMGQMEGYTHQGSLIFIDEAAPATELLEAVHKKLADQQQITFGVSIAPVNGLIIRMLGYKAEQMHDCLKSVSQILTGYRTIQPA